MRTGIEINSSSATEKLKIPVIFDKTSLIQYAGYLDQNSANAGESLAITYTINEKTKINTQATK